MRARTAVIASLISFLFQLGAASNAKAGNLILYNDGGNAVTCMIDGYTKATGAAADMSFRVDPGAKLEVPPNLTTKSSSLNWIDCGGGLRTRAMNITADGPNGILFLNGNQGRTLNVILYSAIPTDPTRGYEPLVRGLTLRYQSKHPDVLLNLVLNPDPFNSAVDLYDFDNLSTNLLGPNGFDVAEIDTVFLTYLVNKNLISPAQITGDEPWPVAKDAATVNGVLYGVPSWLCSDFLFGLDADVSSLATFAQMQKHAASAPAGHRALIGDLDGSWTIPAMYIQAFVQVHPTATLAQALKMPPDPAIIHRMAQLGAFCTLATNNPCIDGSYHNAKDGSVEEAFATDHSENGTGFSERSFFIEFFDQTPRSISLVPLPWGDTPHTRRAVYSDDFVTNTATCGSGACRSDSTEFAAFMTSADTKKYIALSEDLPAGTPPRHLIVATKPFYSLSDVKDDPVYEQINNALLKSDMIAYPNSFSPQLKNQLLAGICPSLKQENSAWICKAPKP